MTKTTFLSKRVSITVGIPTLNSEKNIAQLVKSVLNQHNPNYQLKKVIIYSDGSTDATLKQINKIKDRRISIIEGKHTRGFAYGVQTIIDNLDSTILILLNDDIKLVDNLTLSRLVSAFVDPKVALVGGKIVPLPPKTFIETAVFSSFKAYSKLKLLKNEGNNLFTCDGKIMALSKVFAKELNLTREPVGNVDVFIYFTCISKQFVYRYINVDSVLFRFPQTVNDLINQIRRSQVSRILIDKKFGELATAEFSLPKIEVMTSFVSEFFRNPRGAITLFFVNRVLSVFTQPVNKNFTTWKLAKSTKKL